MKRASCNQKEYVKRIRNDTYIEVFKELDNLFLKFHCKYATKPTREWMAVNTFVINLKKRLETRQKE